MLRFIISGKAMSSAVGALSIEDCRDEKEELGKHVFFLERNVGKRLPWIHFLELSNISEFLDYLLQKRFIFK